MNPTERIINALITDLDAQAGRIMSFGVQVANGLHVTHSLFRKTIALRDSLKALQLIAQWSDPVEGPLLDEPHSTTTARQTLQNIAKLYED